jgi:hypothetical protein
MCKSVQQVQESNLTFFSNYKFTLVNTSLAVANLVYGIYVLLIGGLTWWINVGAAGIIFILAYITYESEMRIIKSKKQIKELNGEIQKIIGEVKKEENI